MGHPDAGAPFWSCDVFSHPTGNVHRTNRLGRIPLYYGGSFAYIAPVTAVAGAAWGGPQVAQVGIVATGLLNLLAGFVVQKAGKKALDRILPPTVTGSIAIVIGIALAKTALDMIYEYFRAAAAQECDALWSRLAEPVRSANEKGDWCRQYESVAAIHVIEIQGYAKADTPRGFRFLPSNEVAEEYYVNLDVKHQPGQRSAWQEGHNHALIPLVRESDGQWRLGVARTAPSL